MITSILANIDVDVPTTYCPKVNPTVYIMPCLMMLLGIAFWGLVVYGLIQLIRFLASARKEQKLIRMELSKLAEEVHLLRKEQKGTDPRATSVNSESENENEKEREKK